jgi:hypothetical protein
MDCVSFSSFSALFYLSFFLGGWVGFALTLRCQLHVSKFLCTVGLGGGGSTFSYKLCLYHVVAVAGFACFFLCNLC